MMTTSTRPINELRLSLQRFSLPDVERLSTPAEEDEDDFDESTDSESRRKTSPSDLTYDLLISQQRRSILSAVTTSILPDRPLSRSYKFVQLERALTVANLLADQDDRIQFQHDYRRSLQENKFEEFLQKFYKKLKDHKEKLARERALKTSRSFTFVDLENNFLALDPTRAIKVVFLDDPSKSTGLHRNSNLSNSPEDDSIEIFYEDHSRRLLRNPSRARNEITLFARHAAERLQERLPHLSDVPHRVKIIDERERKENSDEHTLLQMKHKHALSSIAKRRRLIDKMINQTRKNQTKMQRLNFQPPLAMANPSCCRELLERINRFEHTIEQERSHTAFTTRKTISKTTNYSSIQTTRTTTDSTTPSFSSCSTQLPVALSIYHAEKSNNARIILPKRSFSAPIGKLAWVNYC